MFQLTNKTFSRVFNTTDLKFTQRYVMPTFERDHVMAVKTSKQILQQLLTASD